MEEKIRGKRKSENRQIVVGEGGGEGYIEMGEIEQTVCVCLQKRIVHALKRHQSYSWYYMCQTEPI
jgi:hypothetical protein